MLLMTDEQDKKTLALSLHGSAPWEVPRTGSFLMIIFMRSLAREARLGY